MSVLRSSTLRCVPRHGVALPLQRRWAQVHDVRFVTTHQPSSEKIYEKYREKLEQKAKQAGVRNIDQLKRAFLRTNKASHPVTDSSSSAPYEPHKVIVEDAAKERNAKQSHSATAAAAAAAANPPGVKKLSSYVDVEKLSALPPAEIEALWRLRHAPSPRSLCATIPTEVYRRIEATARKHPQFVLPLAKADDAQKDGTGAEIHFLQWTFPTPDTATVLFTHLAEYKLRGEYAQPHTTVTHHLDLADDKGVVLLQGVVTEGKNVSVEEGRALLMYLQKFYGMEEKEERAKLLQQFSEGDTAFRVERLVEETEKII